MDETDRERSHATPPNQAGRRPYERPRILWREPFEPIAFAVASCAKEPGNPACNVGPITA